MKTRILVLSDTHSALPRPPGSGSVDDFRWPLPKADILIHAGDLTMNGKLEQHQRALELIRGVDAELKIVIPGNHDLTLDRSYYEKHGTLHGPKTAYAEHVLDEIQELYTGKPARDAGIVYMVEGFRTFSLASGATFNVYASAYQPEFWNWAFGYSRDQDRFNSQCSDTSEPTGAANPVPEDAVDIMVTHGPPMDTLDQTHRGEIVGCQHLASAVERCKPLLHVFGHIHEAWGAVTRDWKGGSSVRPQFTEQREYGGCNHAYHDASGLRHGHQTLFVNASIMDLSYRASQLPWVLDLNLPARPI
jgi:predicted phosphohydrolase